MPVNNSGARPHQPVLVSVIVVALFMCYVFFDNVICLK